MIKIRNELAFFRLEVIFKHWKHQNIALPNYYKEHIQISIISLIQCLLTWYATVCALMNVSQKASHKTNFRNISDNSRLQNLSTKQTNKRRHCKWRLSVCVCVLGEWITQGPSGGECLRTLKCNALTRLCRFVSQLHHAITWVILSKPFTFSMSVFLMHEIGLVWLFWLIIG